MAGVAGANFFATRERARRVAHFGHPLGEFQSLIGAQTGHFPSLTSSGRQCGYRVNSGLTGPSHSGLMHGNRPDLPKKIHLLWLQGLAAAPDLIRICHGKWVRLNPDYEVVVLDGDDVARLLEGTSIPFRSMPVQALSDIVRARLLLDQGGVWADSSVMPIAPLEGWLPEAVGASGFFAFERPGPDRPISSWFLASAPGNRLLALLWREIERFWSRPRRIVHYPKEIAPDPIAEVAPEAGGAGDTYPYYWFHYLFRYVIETDPEGAALWRRCAHRSALPALRLLLMFESKPDPSLFEIMDAASGAPVHKLDWRAPYPLDLFAALGEQMHVFVRPQDP